MAKFKITPKTTVAELKEQFRKEIGGVLRVYEGRSQAPADATLVSLGAKEGELECRANRTVGKFEEAFQNELNLKVRVYTKDNWVKVLDGITLASAAELPNGMTKAKMEEHLSYQREEKEEDSEINKSTSMEEHNKLFIDTAKKCTHSIAVKAHSFPNPVSSFEDFKQGLKEVQTKCKIYGEGVVIPLVLSMDQEGQTSLSFIQQDRFTYNGYPFRFDAEDPYSLSDNNLDFFDIEFAKRELINTNSIKKFYYCHFCSYPPVNPWDRSLESLEASHSDEEKEAIANNEEALFPLNLWSESQNDESSFGHGSLIGEWFDDLGVVAVTDDGHVLVVNSFLKV